MRLHRFYLSLRRARTTTSTTSSSVSQSSEPLQPFLVLILLRSSCSFHLARPTPWCLTLTLHPIPLRPLPHPLQRRLNIHIHTTNVDTYRPNDVFHTPAWFSSSSYSATTTSSRVLRRSRLFRGSPLFFIFGFELAQEGQLAAEEGLEVWPRLGFRGLLGRGGLEAEGRVPDLGGVGGREFAGW